MAHYTLFNMGQINNFIYFRRFWPPGYHQLIGFEDLSSASPAAVEQRERKRKNKSSSVPDFKVDM